MAFPEPLREARSTPEEVFLLEQSKPKVVLQHVGTLLGIALISGGVALIFWPASLIVAGFLIAAYSILVIDDTKPPKPINRQQVVDR